MRAKILKVHAILSDNIPCFSDKHKEEFPYVTLADFEPEHSNAGRVPVHVWSRERGRGEVKNLMFQIYDLLHDKEGLRYDSQITFFDSDGMTHHGVITFKHKVRRKEND